MKKKNGGVDRSVREQVHKCKNLLVLAHCIILDVNALVLLFPSKFALAENFTFTFSSSSTKFLIELLNCNKILLK